MAIVQISKIQQRAGNLVDLPQLDNGEFGWATDTNRLFIGKTGNVYAAENIEVLSSYSNISFSQIVGSDGGNFNISAPQNGQILTYVSSTDTWENYSGNTSQFSGTKLQLGSVSNISMTGGAIGYVLETDGLGNLSWTPKNALITTIIGLTNNVTGNIVTMTVANTTPYTNGQLITISGANISNSGASANINGQTFYVKVDANFGANSSVVGSGNVVLYTDIGLLTTANGAGLVSYTANTGIATAALGGSGGGTGVGGANTSVQFNDQGVSNGVAGFTFNKSTTTLTVTPGNIVTQNIYATALINAPVLVSNIATGTAPFTVTSTTQVANLSVATAGSATTAGTVTTAAQSNITSVGTLTSLNSSGTITAPAFTANTGVFTGNGSALTALNASNVSSGTLAQVRLANASLTVNGTSIALGGSGTVTATATNALTIGSGLGGTSYNGSSAVTITNSGVTSIVAGTNISISGGTGAVTVNVSGTVASANTAGTVTTAAQGNITSVGTLTGLTVSSTIIGSVSGSAATAGSATTAGTVTTAAQGNITSVGTLTGLTLANAAIISVGSNTNVGTFTGNFSLSAGSRLNATYADLAEYYEADTLYEAGTVLTFGGDKEVTISEDGTQRVAGVVSTNPAYVMNSACEGEYIVAVALQGRVPCKVRGTIRKGDMLTSGSDGYARPTSHPIIGSVIGKALENFVGEGIIEVAVGRL